MTRPQRKSGSSSSQRSSSSSGSRRRSRSRDAGRARIDDKRGARDDADDVSLDIPIRWYSSVCGVRGETLRRINAGSGADVRFFGSRVPCGELVLKGPKKATDRARLLVNACLRGARLAESPGGAAQHGEVFAEVRCCLKCWILSLC
mmetsp:Transcript_53584/g.122637  ORF Transcript_53584/g.122637 Transcript_53584/m.122637 type:complete len:147 (-) Transcript_53584:2933-3373(-)